MVLLPPSYCPLPMELAGMGLMVAAFESRHYNLIPQAAYDAMVVSLKSLWKEVRLAWQPPSRC